MVMELENETRDYFEPHYFPLDCFGGQISAQPMQTDNGGLKFGGDWLHIIFHRTGFFLWGLMQTDNGCLKFGGDWLHIIFLRILFVGAGP